MKQKYACTVLCWVSVLLAFALGTLTSTGANGSPPELMTYQGYLTDGDGSPLGNTAPKNYDVIFRIWDAQSAGKKLWTEQQTVTVDKGYFSVLLGEGAMFGSDPRPPLSTVFTNTANASDRFIEITVRGLGSPPADVVIEPRLRFLTSPYAFLAHNAVSAGNLVNSGNSQVVSITGTNVGINKLNANSALDVVGTVTATGLTINGTATLTNVNGPTTFNADLGVTGNHIIEFGKTLAKQADAGKIGYQRFGAQDALDIVGAGVDQNSRKVKIWAEGGMAVSGAVTATAFVGNGTIPVGGIIMWSGSTVPAGWHLCDGASGTPDLRGRFVLGSSSSYALKTSGGSANHTLTVPEMPGHSHSVYYQQVFTGRSSNTGDNQYADEVRASSTTTVNTATSGGGTAFSTMPPYFVLAYIMRVQ